MLQLPRTMKSLSFYPICKLMIACHSFMDACRYETPGSETKDLITHGTAGSLNFMFTMFLLCKARGCDTEQPRWTLQCSASVSWLRSPECLKGVQGPNFKGIILLKGTASKPTQPLSVPQRKTLYLPRLFARQMSFKR